MALLINLQSCKKDEPVYYPQESPSTAITVTENEVATTASGPLYVSTTTARIDRIPQPTRLCSEPMALCTLLPKTG